MSNTTFDNRWQNVIHTWHSNAWLFGVVGFVLGMLAVPAAEQIISETRDLLAGLVPEAFGIVFTVLIIDRLYRNREKTRREREAQERLIRAFSSADNATALTAVEELRYRGELQSGLLSGVRMSWKANLKGADLSGATLVRTNLHKADLSGARIVGADLRTIRLNGANLIGANLENSNMKESQLRAANLTAVEAMMTDFSDSLLGNANFTDGNLFTASFRGASLENVNFYNAVLQGASFEQAVLIDANLEGANLENATMDHRTILPDYKLWTPNTDMTRYTNPDHPDFWQPEWVRDQ
ncbi:MAG: pentapeptide repeat-containing protein [Chloroflexota bacterium]